MNDGKGETPYMMNYAGFGLLAIQAIQEQQVIIDAQEERHQPKVISTQQMRPAGPTSLITVAMQIHQMTIKQRRSQST